MKLPYIAIASAMVGVASSFAGVTASSVRAEVPRSKKIVGFLGTTSPNSSAHWLTALKARMGELGWNEGKNIEFKVRWTHGIPDKADQYAKEFVAEKVDAIVTWAPWATLIAKRATSKIPIIFPINTNPVELGLIASIAKPGGNVTGVIMRNIELAEKRVQLLREVVPGLTNIAVMHNSNMPTHTPQYRMIASLGKKLGFTTQSVAIRRPEDIDVGFRRLQDGVQAIVVLGGPLTFSERSRIVSWQNKLKLPAVYVHAGFVASGGLLAYGTNFPYLFEQAAEMVDKVLRGANPANIPVMRASRFDLSINLKTARRLGLKISPSLLALADKVIE